VLPNQTSAESTKSGTGIIHGMVMRIMAWQWCGDCHNQCFRVCVSFVCHESCQHFKQSQKTHVQNVSTNSGTEF